MSERNNGTTPAAADSIVGLAMTVGNMQSEQHHFAEQMLRERDEDRAALAEEIIARESENAELRDVLASMSEVVQSLVEVVERIAPPQAETVTEAVKDAPRSITPPVRTRNESNRDFHSRLITWASEHETTEPPKPKGTEFINAYDKRVQAWIKDARA